MFARIQLPGAPHADPTGMRQHTSAYVSIRQHTSEYVSIRQTTSAYASIRQHTSAYVSIRELCRHQRKLPGGATS
jgi:hypothetical protein